MPQICGVTNESKAIKRNLKLLNKHYYYGTCSMKEHCPFRQLTYASRSSSKLLSGILDMFLPTVCRKNQCNLRNLKRSRK